MYGVALTIGIGFTMSFFIGTLAFENVDAQFTDAMKIGVLGGSCLSLIAASIVLFMATRESTANTAVEDDH